MVHTPSLGICAAIPPMSSSREICRLKTTWNCGADIYQFQFRAEVFLERLAGANGVCEEPCRFDSMVALSLAIKTVSPTNGKRHFP